MVSGHVRPLQRGDVCAACGLEVFESSSCVPHHVTVGGVEVPCRRWVDESVWSWDGVDPPDALDECHSCGVSPDGFHHEGCAVEECPVDGCGAQLLFCHHAAVSPRKRRSHRGRS